MKEPVRPRPIHYMHEARRRSPSSRLLRLAAVLAGLGALGLAALVVTIWQVDLTPRDMARILARSTGTLPRPIGEMASFLATQLDRQERLPLTLAALPGALGASPSRNAHGSEGAVHAVTNTPALVDAVAAAKAGDVLVLAAGHYRIGATLHLLHPGTATAPITIRAERLGDAVLDSETTEAIKVTAPFWRLENLVIRGTCANAGDCEHAIHVAGRAVGVVIRNNRIEDFNAQIKVNGEDGAFPDRGVIEGNTLLDTVPRATSSPVTPIDLVAANGWRIRGNVIADFLRADGGTTYGAYAKGAGEDNIIERNLVICEWHLHAPGGHVGISLGGGGTGVEFRRDLGRTELEQQGGIIRDNLVVGCSDAGIYLNRAARSVVDRNTLLDTAGIQGQTIETSGRITANIVDGVIQARDGAALHDWDNLSASLFGLYAGLHPQRRYFRDPAALDLTWRAEPGPVSEPSDRTDLCGQVRTPLAPAGAFADYRTCLAGQ